MSIKLKINSDFKSAEMHLWSKFGYPTISYVTIYCVDKLQMGVNLAFRIKFDIEVRGQPKYTIGVLTQTNVFCTVCPNLVVLAWTDDGISRGRTRVLGHFYGHTHSDRRRRWQYPNAKTGLG